MKKKKYILPILFFYLIISLTVKGILYAGDKISLKESFKNSLLILVDDLLKIQNTDKNSSNYGAFYCEACKDYHARASETVLPFTIAYKETGDEKYLSAAISTGDWLINQQKEDGSWFETPSEWTGTTTDQLLMMAASFPLLEKYFTSLQSLRWKESIKKAADWLVINMNHEFASINYCATTTATLAVVYQIFKDQSYVSKADELAYLLLSKMDEDYFLTGEGNRIRGTKYGIDLGYNMDMSMWGLGLYAKLMNNKIAEEYVRKSLKRLIYFIYPDGSTDGSWGVRSSKWTTYGSLTADGSQILFSLFSDEDPVYRTAALANMNYFMKMRERGLLTLGPHYYFMYDSPPCIYPTFCRAKNLAMAILYGDQSDGETPPLPTQNSGWSKYFKTIDVALVKTKNFMATVTGYSYKDMRRGADFKYMHRPSGGSITNLWVENYGYLQASSQTEYFQWEFNYPKVENTLTLTPRIEFTDSNAYYANLYEFDSRIYVSENNDEFIVTASGELKDRNRWEGGVAYNLTHIIADQFIEKKIKLRFHGSKSEVRIVEPFIQNPNTTFNKISDNKVEILGGTKEFIFELISKDCELEIGTDNNRYNQPLPSLKGYPFIIKVKPGNENFLKEVHYRIKIK
jgi:hypothetical protein